MTSAPCLYFGTRRTTYSDVVSIVTTVRPLPTIKADSPTLAAASVASVSPARARATQKATFSKSYATHKSTASLFSTMREPQVLQAWTGFDSPLQSVAHQKWLHQQHQTQALASEKRFFLHELHTKRLQRLDVEQHAALLIQKVHRGYLLRKKFWQLKNRLEIRKKIRSNLNKVTRGTAIILGEKERRRRKLQLQQDAAVRIQHCFRCFAAKRLGHKERTNRGLEKRNSAAQIIQKHVRRWTSQRAFRKLRQHKQQEARQLLAKHVSRLFKGYKARQWVRAMRIRRQFCASCTIQHLARKHLARKVVKLHRMRHQQTIHHHSAIQIQKYFRLVTQRKAVYRMRMQEHDTITLACVLVIQRFVRGFLGRRRAKFARFVWLEGHRWQAALHMTRLVRGFLGRQRTRYERFVQETDIFVQTRLGNFAAVVDLLDGYDVESPIDIKTLDDRNQNSILHVASRFGHLKIAAHVLPRMLENAPQMLHVANGKGETALELAILNRHEDVADYLMSKGVKMPPPRKGRTILHEAARNGMAATVEKILLTYTHLLTGDEKDEVTRRTMLHEAIWSGEVKTVTAVVTKSHCNIDAQDFIGFTALHLAAQLGNIKLAKLLLEHDANVTITDNQRRTAWRVAVLEGNETCSSEIRAKWLSETTRIQDKKAFDPSREIEGNLLVDQLFDACSLGDVDKTRVLLDLKVSINVTHLDSPKNSLLMAACEAKDVAMVKFVLRKGANVSYVNENNYSALELSLDTEALAHLLVRNGANPLRKIAEWENRTAFHEAAARNYTFYDDGIAAFSVNEQKDDHGQTPIHAAAVSGAEESLRKLLNMGADVAQKTSKMRTALHEAARFGHVRVVQLILKRYPDTALVVDSLGRTALFDAVESGSTECVQMFMDAGIKLDAVDQDGGTLLHAAAESANPRSTEMLDFLMERLPREAQNKTTRTNQWTMLHVACRYGNTAIVEKLFTSSANLTIKRDRKTRQPIQVAAAFGQVRVLDHMERLGYDLSSCDRDTNSFLLHFLMECEGDLDHLADYAIKLIATGNLVSQYNSDGLQPLHIVASKRQPVACKLVQILLDNKAPLKSSTQDKASVNALEIAHECGISWRNLSFLSVYFL